MMSFAENIVVIWMIPILMQIILPLVLLVVFAFIQFIAELFQSVTMSRVAENRQDGTGAAAVDTDIAGELKTVRRTFVW